MQDLLIAAGLAGVVSLALYSLVQMGEDKQGARKTTVNIHKMSLLLIQFISIFTPSLKINWLYFRTRFPLAS